MYIFWKDAVKRAWTLKIYAPWLPLKKLPNFFFNRFFRIISHPLAEITDEYFVFISETPCAFAPCLNGATCQNVGSSYRCNCRDGYNGTRCETEGSCFCSARFFFTKCKKFLDRGFQILIAIFVI